MTNVLIFNEFIHERRDEAVRRVYPDGIHAAIKALLLEEGDIAVEYVTLDNVTDITKERLDKTDVLIWWGHMAHGQVPDEVAYLVKDAVLSGMGIIFLHSAHHSKPMRYLLGTSCNLTWRESDDLERLWVVEPSHPITRGIDRQFSLPAEETYGEPFVIPTPDKLLLISGFSGGEVIRSGCLWERGNGKIFYFRPGHETYPTYYNESVKLIIKNAVRFLTPYERIDTTCPHVRYITEDKPYVIEQAGEFAV